MYHALTQVKYNMLYGFLGVLGILAVMYLLQRLWEELSLKLWPPVSVDAVLVTKRPEVKAKSDSKKAYTVYYMTFQTDEMRKEYKTPAGEYALAAEGDRGVLTLHRKKFKGFAVHKENFHGVHRIKG